MYPKLRKILSLALTISLLFQQIGFAQLATELNIASHLSRMASNLTVEKFRPLHLRYFSYDSLNDNFRVLVDKGDQFANSRGHFPSNLSGSTLKESVPWDEAKLRSETKALLSYFLVGVSLPDSMFWVNLRPDSEDQIIDQYLEKTDVGRIMLEADLQLKKDTAQMTSPATPEGREYWNKLYKKAEELYGYENVTIPTLTRPWIVPGEIIIRETTDDGSWIMDGGKKVKNTPSAYIYKATLKVMLEQDYLKDSTLALTSAYSFKDARSKALNEYSSQLIRELIIPKLTKEVNSSKRYAPLRQVYYSLILSRWFKLRFTGKTGTYASLINTKDLTNLISQGAWSKTDYFKQYRKSFAEGEYNIKEPVYTPTGQTIRSYFSGGLDLEGAASPINNPSGFTSSPISPKILSSGFLLQGKSIDEVKVISPGAASPIFAASRVEIDRIGARVLGKITNARYGQKQFLLSESKPESGILRREKARLALYQTFDYGATKEKLLFTFHFEGGLPMVTGPDIWRKRDNEWLHKVSAASFAQARDILISYDSVHGDLRIVASGEESFEALKNNYEIRLEPVRFAASPVSNEADKAIINEALDYLPNDTLNIIKKVIRDVSLNHYKFYIDQGAVEYHNKHKGIDVFRDFGVGSKAYDDIFHEMDFLKPEKDAINRILQQVLFDHQLKLRSKEEIEKFIQYVENYTFVINLDEAGPRLRTQITELAGIFGLITTEADVTFYKSGWIDTDLVGRAVNIHYASTRDEYRRNKIALGRQVFNYIPGSTKIVFSKKSSVADIEHKLLEMAGLSAGKSGLAAVPVLSESQRDEGQRIFMQIKEVLSKWGQQYKGDHHYAIFSPDYLESKFYFFIKNELKLDYHKRLYAGVTLTDIKAIKEFVLSCIRAIETDVATLNSMGGKEVLRDNDPIFKEATRGLKSIDNEIGNLITDITKQSSAASPIQINEAKLSWPQKSLILAIAASQPSRFRNYKEIARYYVLPLMVEFDKVFRRPPTQEETKAFLRSFRGESGFFDKYRKKFIKGKAELFVDKMIKKIPDRVKYGLGKVVETNKIADETVQWLKKLVDNSGQGDNFSGRDIIQAIWLLSPYTIELAKQGAIRDLPSFIYIVNRDILLGERGTDNDRLSSLIRSFAPGDKIISAIEDMARDKGRDETITLLESIAKILDSAISDTCSSASPIQASSAVDAGRLREEIEAGAHRDIGWLRDRIREYARIDGSRALPLLKKIALGNNGYPEGTVAIAAELIGEIQEGMSASRVSSPVSAGKLLDKIMNRIVGFTVVWNNFARKLSLRYPDAGLDNVKDISIPEWSLPKADESLVEQKLERFLGKGEEGDNIFIAQAIARARQFLTQLKEMQAVLNGGASLIDEEARKDFTSKAIQDKVREGIKNNKLPVELREWMYKVSVLSSSEEFFAIIDTFLAAMEAMPDGMGDYAKFIKDYVDARVSDGRLQESQAKFVKYSAGYLFESIKDGLKLRNIADILNSSISVASPVQAQASSALENFPKWQLLKSVYKAIEEARIPYASYDGQELSSSWEKAGEILGELERAIFFRFDTDSDRIRLDNSALLKLEKEILELAVEKRYISHIYAEAYIFAREWFNTLDDPTIVITDGEHAFRKQVRPDGLKNYLKEQDVSEEFRNIVEQHCFFNAENYIDQWPAKSVRLPDIVVLRRLDNFLGRVRSSDLYSQQAFTSLLSDMRRRGISGKITIEPEKYLKPIVEAFRKTLWRSPTVEEAWDIYIRSFNDIANTKHADDEQYILKYMGQRAEVAAIAIRLKQNQASSPASSSVQLEGAKCALGTSIHSWRSRLVGVRRDIIWTPKLDDNLFGVFRSMVDTGASNRINFVNELTSMVEDTATRFRLTAQEKVELCNWLSGQLGKEKPIYGLEIQTGKAYVSQYDPEYAGPAEVTSLELRKELTRFISIGTRMLFKEEMSSLLSGISSKEYGSNLAAQLWKQYSEEKRYPELLFKAMLMYLLLSEEKAWPDAAEKIVRERLYPGDSAAFAKLYEEVAEKVLIPKGLTPSSEAEAEFIGSSAQKISGNITSAASSAVDTGRNIGGIDFRALPMTIQPMGSFKGLNFKLPQLTQGELAKINIDSEMQQIRNMVNSGILPSGQRIKELLAACAQKQEISVQADKLLLCLIDICRLEEENAYESEPELREALVIVDAVS